MSDTEKVLIGWVEIASITPYTPFNLTQRFGRKMQDNGYVLNDVFSCSDGRRRRMVYSWPSMVKAFLARELVEKRWNRQDKKKHKNKKR